MEATLDVLNVLLEEAATALTEHKKNVELQELRVAKYEGRVKALDAAIAALVAKKRRQG